MLNASLTPHLVEQCAFVLLNKEKMRPGVEVRGGCESQTRVMVPGFNLDLKRRLLRVRFGLAGVEIAPQVSGQCHMTQEGAGQAVKVESKVQESCL